MTLKHTDSSRFSDVVARLRRFASLSSRQKTQLLLNRAERRLGAGRLRSGPRMLDLVPTHRCNLRCVGCVHYDNEGPGDLELGFFREILAESAPWVVQYRFCSLGEPLMNRDLPEMLELAARAGIGCNLMTNGTLLTPELAEHLVARCKIDILTFSIDGATAETCERLRRGLKFDDLMEAVTSVVESKRRHGAGRPVVQANAIAMKDNADELPDLVRLAARLGIEDLNVHYLTVEGRTQWENSLFSDPDRQKEIFDEMKRVGDELGVVTHLPPDVRDAEFMQRCYLPWDTLIIDTDGTARMCYFSWEEPVGNVVEDGGIRAVWNNALYRKVRETIETDCPFYRYCAHCGYRVGYSRREAHEGKSGDNEKIFSFDWDRPDAPPRPGGSRLRNPDRRDN
ncbi:MAG: radical SAM protein [Candidatus Eisenbacteria bacterium]|nr:radical SAM protein [Candidatus Eisenbacteria bacterium]